MLGVEPNLLWSAFAVVVFAVCAGLCLGANPWEPLAGGAGAGIVLCCSLAVGLVGGRRRSLLAALVLAPLALLTRAPEPGLFVALVMPLLVVACAAAIGLGVVLRSLAGRAGPRAGIGARLLGAVLLSTAAAATARGVYLANRVVDYSPTRPVLIDDRVGTYRGISLGAPFARVRRMFGNPEPGGRSLAPSPSNIATAGLSGPGSLPPWPAWRYRDLVVLVDRGRVRGFLTTDPQAETTAGVGLRDSLVIARHAYANLDCFGVTLGSDASNPQYLACEGHLPRGGSIWFGGDPIDSIWVTESYERAPGPPIRRRR